MNGDIISLTIQSTDYKSMYLELVCGILNHASIFEITNIKFYGICINPNDFNELVRLSISVDTTTVTPPPMNILNVNKYIIDSEILAKYLKHKGNMNEI